MSQKQRFVRVYREIGGGMVYYQKQGKRFVKVSLPNNSAKSVGNTQRTVIENKIYYQPMKRRQSKRLGLRSGTIPRIPSANAIVPQPFVLGAVGKDMGRYTAYNEYNENKRRSDELEAARKEARDALQSSDLSNAERTEARELNVALGEEIELLNKKIADYEAVFGKQPESEEPEEPEEPADGKTRPQGDDAGQDGKKNYRPWLEAQYTRLFKEPPIKSASDDELLLHVFRKYKNGGYERPETYTPINDKTKLMMLKSLVKATSGDSFGDISQDELNNPEALEGMLYEGMELPDQSPQDKPEAANIVFKKWDKALYGGRSQSVAKKVDMIKYFEDMGFPTSVVKKVGVEELRQAAIALKRMTPEKAAEGLNKYFQSLPRQEGIAPREAKYESKDADRETAAKNELEDYYKDLTDREIANIAKKLSFPEEVKDMRNYLAQNYQANTASPVLLQTLAERALNPDKTYSIDNLLEQQGWTPIPVPQPVQPVGAADPPYDPDFKGPPKPDAQPQSVEGQGRLWNASTKEGLWTEDINALLEPYTRKGYLGAFSIDEAPLIVPLIKKNAEQQTGFIVCENGHWIAIYISPVREKTIEFYNSFAEPPSPAMLRFMKLVTDALRLPYLLRLKENRVAQQYETDARCGLHAASFLERRFEGEPFKNITIPPRILNDAAESTRLLKKRFGNI